MLNLREVSDEQTLHQTVSTNKILKMLNFMLTSDLMGPF